jgi:hypothetical protein
VLDGGGPSIGLGTVIATPRSMRFLLLALGAIAFAWATAPAEPDYAQLGAFRIAPGAAAPLAAIQTGPAPDGARGADRNPTPFLAARPDANRFAVIFPTIGSALPR